MTQVPLETRLRRSYYWRMALLAVMFAACSLVVVYAGIRVRSRLAAVGVVPFTLWAGIALSDYLRGPKSLDREGVTRRDGKRFLWADLKQSRDVSGRYPWGQATAPVFIELRFTGGSVRVFPMVFENAGEIMAFLNDRDKKPPEAPLPPAPPRPRHETCGTCSSLKNCERGLQTGGREHLDTFLPPAVASLKFVKEIRPGKTRSPDLEICPACGTYYLFEVTYEYLATGSEDEQILTRLTDEEAQKYLDAGDVTGDRIV